MRAARVPVSGRAAARVPPAARRSLAASSRVGAQQGKGVWRGPSARSPLSRPCVTREGGREAGRLAAAGEEALLCVRCALVTPVACGLSPGAAWAGGSVAFRFPCTGWLFPDWSLTNFFSRGALCIPWSVCTLAFCFLLLIQQHAIYLGLAV